MTIKKRAPEKPRPKLFRNRIPLSKEILAALKLYTETIAPPDLEVRHEELLAEADEYKNNINQWQI